MSRKEEGDSHLTRTYARCSVYSTAEQGIKRRHKVQEAVHADQIFACGHYVECQQLCYNILQAQPSEAIQARCRMYLAGDAVGPEYASVRA